jgi:hypothetical protein
MNDHLLIICTFLFTKKITGFGNSAGLIANRGLLAPSRTRGNYSSDSEESDTEEYLNMVDKINPVTGKPSYFIL